MNNKIIKNEHIVWAYAERADGSGQVVMAGITDMGATYLKENPGKTLVIDSPMENGFTNVRQIFVFQAKSKDDLKAMFRAAGTVVSEVN